MKTQNPSKTTVTVRVEWKSKHNAKRKDKGTGLTHPKLHHQSVDDGANHGDEVKNVPGILEKILGRDKLERAEYDGPGLELERSVEWSGATKRSVDWSGAPEGGGRDRESQGQGMLSSPGDGAGLYIQVEQAECT
ncbi:hypothetical protein E2C01_005165 [Portunus trituberculatus]|uniref:Uncharacterized protein n=1 Tax=Portunus trituberculatus TaxID=210409 RepID=A0A5B7CVW6_PORTR|nr:hypothetical protein [Portunus trituberculatus]